MSARPTARTPAPRPDGERPKLALDVPDELIEVIAKRAQQLIADAQPEHKWANTEEAAERLRCPRSRIYERVARGGLRAYKDGTRSLFLVADLDALVEESSAQ